MKLDYSPAERQPRSAKRIVLAASVCVFGLAALVSRESTATRGSLDATLLSEAEMAEAMTFEQAISVATASAVTVPRATEWATLNVKSGDTLSTLFESRGLGQSTWLAILGLGNDARQLKYVKAGEKIEILQRDGELVELRYALDDLRTLHVRKTEAGYTSNTLTAEVERSQRVVAGVIDSSLFVAGQKAGLPVRAVMNLAELFRYDIDFALDLRRGDRFSVVIEELYKDGKKLRDGDLLAAEFINQGKTHRAVRYMDSKGRAAYYTPEGQSLRKAFFRTPLDVVRISSHFNMHRRHPILNTIRAHKGVDYAARAGTPIKATGKGRVKFVGSKSGYGRTVVLQHGSKYETLYAHMSRFARGLRNGSPVKQGQVIGYVGSSGLATAAHLHYEFRVNGIHKNPVKIVMPRANPIARQQLAAFRLQVMPLLAQIDAADVPEVAMSVSGILPAISATSN